MKPASFRYLAPRSEDELLSVLDEHGADARLLAGGQSLVPMMNFRVVSPAVIVDINHIKTLSFIKHASSSIDVGALTRHAMLEDSGPVRAELPIIAETMGYLAHRAVRNRGTIGGSLALAYPNAELPLLCVALGAELRLHSRNGERRMPVSQFITGPLDTVLADGEFVHSALLPVPPRSAGTAFVEVSRRHGDFALSAAAAVVDLDGDGRVRAVQAAVSGGQGFPIRVSDAEGALTGHQLKPTLIEDAARATVEALTVDDDPQFPSGYRKLLLTTVLQRALETAARRGEQQRVN